MRKNWILIIFFCLKISFSIGNGANNALYEGPSTKGGEAKQNDWMSHKYDDNKKSNAPKSCFKRLSCFHSDLTSSSSSSSVSSRGSNNMVGMSRYPSRDHLTGSNSTQSVGSTTNTAQSNSSSTNSASTQFSSRGNHEADFQKAHSVFINQLRSDIDRSANQSESDLFYTFKFW